MISDLSGSEREPSNIVSSWLPYSKLILHIVGRLGCGAETIRYLMFRGMKRRTCHESRATDPCLTKELTIIAMKHHASCLSVWKAAQHRAQIFPCEHRQRVFCKACSTDILIGMGYIYRCLHHSFSSAVLPPCMAWRCRICAIPSLPRSQLPAFGDEQLSNVMTVPRVLYYTITERLLPASSRRIRDQGNVLPFGNGLHSDLAGCDGTRHNGSNGLSHLVCPSASEITFKVRYLRIHVISLFEVLSSSAMTSRVIDRSPTRASRASLGFPLSKDLTTSSKGVRYSGVGRLSQIKYFEAALARNADDVEVTINQSLS
ncbi:hypothetical protein WG66_001108 [Moniliophthora roreri]|nr:hypothetical protein WG66_001108 [Moniliophthora roreri]